MTADKLNINLVVAQSQTMQDCIYCSGSTVKHKFAYLADGRKLHSISDPANDGGLAYIGSSVFNIGRTLNSIFSSGPASETTQNLYGQKKP